MTPLEKAKQKQTEQPCSCCEKSERIDGILYCGVSGKIILPQFENIPCCRGKYKGAVKDDKQND